MELKLNQKQADRAIRALDTLNDLGVLTREQLEAIHATISHAETAYEESQPVG